MSVEQEFFDTYLKIYRPYINRMNQILNSYDLYSSQWLILKDIALNPNATSVGISKRRQIEKPTVTKVVNHLLELGLIRVEVGEDRRVKYLNLTGSGDDLYKEVGDKVLQVQRDILNGVGPREIQQLTDYMNQFNI